MRSPMLRIDALRFAPDIVRSQPRTASLLSGNSVLRTDFLQRSEADSAAAGFCIPWLDCKSSGTGARPGETQDRLT